MIKRLLLFLLLIVPLASATTNNYNIIIEDNGNSLVIIEIEGSGMINIPIQKDVNEVKVKGALYKLNNNSVDISIGSTKKAILLYKTSLLTKKEQSIWTFDISLIDNSNATIAMPKNTIIKNNIPEAFIQNLNYTRLIFEESGNIKLIYEFKENEIIIDPYEEPLKPVKEKTNYSIFYIGSILIALISIVLVLKNKKSSKENVIKTLSKNERLVVNTLIETNGEIKRNYLERKTKVAKSSLANTLNILERKKIIIIDKTNVTHYIKFTRWFDEL